MPSSKALNAASTPLGVPTGAGVGEVLVCVRCTPEVVVVVCVPVAGVPFAAGRGVGAGLATTVRWRDGGVDVFAFWAMPKLASIRANVRVSEKITIVRFSMD